jgi:S1-C subfamily serine protease
MVRVVVRVAVVAVVVAAMQAGTVTPTLSARLDVLPVSMAAADELLGRATVEVTALGCDLSLRQGTAVVVAPDQVLTNAHVVGRFRSVDVSADGRPVIATAAVLASPAADLAVVDAGGLALGPLSLAPDDPLPGEPVRVAGFPHDEHPTPGATTTADGLVIEATSVVDYVDGGGMALRGVVMRLGAAVTPGMSGGPVLDRAGRLAGLVFGEQSPTGDALAIPASELRMVLAGGLTGSPGC